MRYKTQIFTPVGSNQIIVEVSCIDTWRTLTETFDSPCSLKQIADAVTELKGILKRGEQ